nr:helix-turn-helix transcriptional regulator [Streptomyces sp. FT05W]
MQRFYDFIRRHPTGVDILWAVLLLGFSGVSIVTDQIGAGLAHVRWLTGNGGRFRGCATPLPEMIVFDGSVALVPLDPRNTAAGALQVADPGLVAPLVVLFEQTWSSATPLDPGRLPADDIPNGKERALLRLVAEGCTDAAAAGQLHVSHRTARRMMAVLMERLGARSRFEAGVKAARRGWL